MNALPRYELWTAPADLASYRPDYSPRPELALCGIWPGTVLRGESGREYFFMLTIGDADRPVVQISNAEVIGEAGIGRRSAPLLLEDVPLRRHSRYQCSDEDGAVTYRSKLGVQRFTVEGYTWTGFDGAIDLRVQNLGDAVMFRIPVQQGITMPVWHQSQTGFVTGHVGDDPVYGVSLLDYVWSAPGTSWLDTEAFREIEKHWTMWVVEYEDGTFDGGYAWKGKPPWRFDAGHLIENGNSSGCQTVQTDVAYGEVGLPERIRLDYGVDYHAEIEFSSLADWPLHPVGRVVATSRPTPIRRSMAITEWIPDNIGDILDKKIPGLDGYLNLHTFPSVIESGRIVPA